jgi:AAA family ATP:ADP antiporter
VARVAEEEVTAFLRRIVPVRDLEVPALLWGFAQMFFLLAGNYVTRPIRESLGSARGSVDLKYLYLGTFVATLVATALWSWLVARHPVRRFVTIAYEFFALAFLGFWALLRFGAGRYDETLVGYVFFVWYSVYNVFIVSTFWSRAADLFTLEQGKRLFPFMAAGASLGAVAGSAVTRFLVDAIGTIDLLLVPVCVLQVALLCSGLLSSAAARTRSGEAAPPPERVATTSAGRGSVLSGLRKVLASPLLLMIATYVLSASFCGTCVYTMNADLARERYANRDDRTEYFAGIDLAVNVFAFLSETLLTPKIIAWIGVGAALMILPAVYTVGFTAGSLAPVLATVAALSIAQRATAYGFTTPAREALFTVIPREEKYKAKNAIDTFVWRGGDVAAQWAIQLLLVTTVGTAASPSDKAGAVAVAGIPAALLWLLAAWRLRRLHRGAASAVNPVRS